MLIKLYLILLISLFNIQSRKDLLILCTFRIQIQLKLQLGIRVPKTLIRPKITIIQADFLGFTEILNKSNQILVDSTEFLC